MSEDEDQDNHMEISINYGERDGLKSSKSRTFKVDKIVLIKDDLPEFEITADKLQHPTYIQADGKASTTEERFQFILKYLWDLREKADAQITAMKEMMEIQRKKDEIDKQKDMQRTLGKYMPPPPQKEE
jgi:hypothetical protein